MYYSGSSQSSYSFSSNGSHPIQCYECQLIIGETVAPFNRALCEVCQRALAGTPMTPEQMKIYRESKQQYQKVGLLVIEEEEVVPASDKFSLRKIGGDLLHAIGLPKPKPKAQRSKVVTEHKRREGLFKNVDLTSEEQKEESND